jgi:hypothetical protein
MPEQSHTADSTTPTSHIPIAPPDADPVCRDEPHAMSSTGQVGVGNIDF